MEIKILGSGCPKCKRLEQLAREAVQELGMVSGRVPHKDEIKALLQTV